MGTMNPIEFVLISIVVAMLSIGPILMTFGSLSMISVVLLLMREDFKKMWSRKLLHPRK